MRRREFWTAGTRPCNGRARAVERVFLAQSALATYRVA
jgi:hypothetical protein